LAPKKEEKKRNMIGSGKRIGKSLVDAAARKKKIFDKKKFNQNKKQKKLLVSNISWTKNGLKGTVSY
jgi:hypothetical protein